MTVIKGKKRFDRNQEELRAIAKEFAQKVKDNQGVMEAFQAISHRHLHPKDRGIGRGDTMTKGIIRFGVW